MTLHDLNAMEREEAGNHLFSCCGSIKWKELMLKNFPFAHPEELLKHAEQVWYQECNEADWIEAFQQHPRIGDEKNLALKYPATHHLAGDEQSGVKTASAEIIRELAAANREYEAKFGFLFIVCATGKSAEQMLRLLKDRLSNGFREELNVAMGEHYKITVLRFQKLFKEADWQSIPNSQLTTHVLDTSLGKPGNEITIRLKHFKNGTWECMAQGISNMDGRINDLLAPGIILVSGNYKMVFETAHYFTVQNSKVFYPEVEIQFVVFDAKHYHVPLLINPFGYTTYRGS